jgi:hypothetical protein
VLKDLYRRLVQQGLRMVCIVTKVDLVDAAAGESVSHVPWSHDIHLLRNFVSLETGMPVNQARCCSCVHAMQ